MEIDKKYLVSTHGKYHKGVNYCPHCDHYPDSVFAHIVGFCNSRIGNLVVVECPKCFEKWSYHSRIETEEHSHYNYFLEFVSSGQNLHHKP